MSIVERTYGSINDFTWNSLSLFGYLQAKTLISTKHFTKEWMVEIDTIANLLIEEYSETSVQLPYLAEFGDKFTFNISKEFEKNAVEMSSQFEGITEDVIYYQYLVTLIRIFSLYSDIMNTDMIKSSPFFENYTYNKGGFDEFIGLVKHDKIVTEKELLSLLKDKNQTIIHKLESSTEALIDAWIRELKEYIGILND